MTNRSGAGILDLRICFSKRFLILRDLRPSSLERFFGENREVVIFLKKFIEKIFIGEMPRQSSPIADTARRPRRRRGLPRALRSCSLVRQL